MNDLESARNKLDKYIRDFDVSLMSNSKWVKVFRCLSGLEDIKCKAQVKLVWDSKLRHIQINDSLQYDLDFYAKSMENMISGSPNGFYEYREIEWLEMNASETELKRIEGALQKVGCLDIVSNSSMLRLIAYK
ncbi:hypothetical protein M2G46_21450 [Vibrio vulnificus]|nr:hypothetical protein [Vibrio vulnificus]